MRGESGLKNCPSANCLPSRFTVNVCCAGMKAVLISNQKGVEELLFPMKNHAKTQMILRVVLSEQAFFNRLPRS
jgi:hypothetical protein